MTRKDYILIAEALQKGYQSTCVGDCIKAVANALQTDNPRFDREHFLAVVRGEKNLNSQPARYAEWMRHKEEDKLRAEKSPNLVISWREDNNQFFAMTADGKFWLTTREEYDRVHKEALQNEKLFLLSSFSKAVQS